MLPMVGLRRTFPFCNSSTAVSLLADGIRRTSPLYSMLRRSTVYTSADKAKKLELDDEKYMTMNYYYKHIRRRKIMDLVKGKKTRLLLQGNFVASEQSGETQPSGLTRSDFEKTKEESEHLAASFEEMSLIERLAKIPQVSSTTQQVLANIKGDGPSYYAKGIIKGRFFSFQAGDELVMHKLKNVEIGDVIRLTQITEIGSANYTMQGAPFIDPTWWLIRARVIEHARGKKVLAARGKQRKGRRKKATMKPEFTKLEILQIKLNPALNL